MSRLFITGPWMGEIVDLEGRRDDLLDRIKEVGFAGIRVGVNPFTNDANPEFGNPETSRFVDFATAVRDKGLDLNVLIYPITNLISAEWGTLYVGIPWSQDPTLPPPNVNRPPRGTSDAVWSNLRRQTQFLIDDIKSVWASAASDRLTFEFANEPACGGAFGLSEGVTTKIKTATTDDTRAIELGEVDYWFHELANYMLTGTGALDFGPHKLMSTTMVGLADSGALAKQIATFIFSDTNTAYQSEFDAWGFNVYPRLASSAQFPPIDQRWATGRAVCAAEVQDRALAQIARMRTAGVAKPLLIQETGVSAFLGGFLYWNGTGFANQFGRPFWYQEQGKYIGEGLSRLDGMGLQRIGVYTSVDDNNRGETGDAFANEGSYALMRTSDTDTLELRASWLTLGRDLGKNYQTNSFTWQVFSTNGETIQPVE